MKRQKSAYAQKLLDPRWQRKRLEILQRDNWTCQHCKDKDNTLHVHHRAYIYGNEPWDYEDKYLVTLCADCHEEEGECAKETLELITTLLKLECYAIDMGEFFIALHAIINSIGADKGSQFFETLATDSEWLNETLVEFKKRYPHRFKQWEEQP